MRNVPIWLKISVILIVVVLIAGGAAFYRILRQRILQELSANLESIAKLKVDQINDWRIARLNEFAVLMDSPTYSQMITGWATSSKADVEAMRIRFEVAQRHYNTKDILLVNNSGQIYPQFGQKKSTLQETARKALETAFSSRKPVISDLYLPPGESSPQLDVIAPFFIRKGNTFIPCNALIHRYDAQQSLYPVVSGWPVPSRTAETLLVRREGSSAVILTNLLHDRRKALSIRISLSRGEFPAVMAVTGKRGFVKGKDYRGTKVLAALKSVPDTPWFLVAKIDEDEAFSALKLESLLIAATVAFLIVSVLTAIGVVWLQSDKARYRAMLEAANAQREIESRYRRTLDGIEEGCQIIGFDWRYLYINATAIRYSGHSEKELLGHTMMECFPGIESSADYEAYNRCMTQRTVQMLESSLDLPDGKKWFDFSIQPIPEGIFILSTEITARKRMEESLRESEAMYRTLFENMSQGVFRLKANRELIDINPAALKILGATRDQISVWLKDNNTQSFVLEDGSPLEDREHNVITALRTGKMASATMGLWNPQKNERVWIATDAIPEFVNGENQPSQVLVTFHDITDRKKMEAERALLASAVEQSGETIVIMDVNGVVQYANPVFEVVTGKKREEAIGHPSPRNNDDLQEEGFHDRLWATISSGKTWRGVMKNRKRDGTQYTEEISISPVFNESGAITNYIAIGRNITDMLRLQEEKEKLQEQFLQVQKMESVGRLAGGVAHDFNNMLSVILGHTQLALDSVNAGHPLHVHLQEIHKAAMRSADLTGQLLAFARKQTVAPKVLDLNETINGLMSLLRRLIGEDIELAWLPGRDIWLVKIDPAQVHQILTNLTVNARDAIDKAGRIAIETENSTIDEHYCLSNPGVVPGEYVTLVASDNGRGMGKEILTHLFEPFFTTKRLGEGTGLGLATVYGIVKQNEGFINVYSEPGRGSTFRIYFPRYIGPANFEKKGLQTEKPAGGLETILIVEDEPSVKTLAETMLKRLGYTVISASTPMEAIGLAEGYGGEIQLLLADVVMPEMTGRQLAERIISIRPAIKRLFMSGYTADVIAHHGVLEEGVHFIQKPFSSKALAAKVREAIEA